MFWLWSPLGSPGVGDNLVCVFLPRPTSGNSSAGGPGRGAGRRSHKSVTSAVPPTDLGLGNNPLPRISIFMSVFDCHVNRSPVAGKVEKIVYHAGKFLNADIDEASVDDERNCLVIATAGRRIAVVQIAGLVARRIVCFVRSGRSVGAGERFGMIRFGSRLDVYLPEGTPPLVAIGQTSIAGETVLADLRAGDADRAFRSG